MKKSVELIKKYWNDRAGSDSSQQSTTMDIWLRDIESRVLSESIKRHQPHNVCDIGCGDGITTIRAARSYPEVNFFGFDYSTNMVKNANENKKKYKLDNLEFCVGDATSYIESNKFDLIYSTRCLINLVDWTAQKKALRNIENSLRHGGTYLMIENFTEGQELFNSLRSSFELPMIQIRDHNTFFDRDLLLEFMSRSFRIDSDVNISSTYYIVSRVIYSSICQQNQLIPDYSDIHHELASKLPFLGEYGPVRAITFIKD